MNMLSHKCSEGYCSKDGHIGSTGWNDHDSFEVSHQSEFDKSKQVVSFDPGL